MYLKILIPLLLCASLRAQLLLAPFTDFVIPGSLELGAAVGYNYKNVWGTRYVFQQGLLQKYYYRGVEVVRYYSTSYDDVFLGSGIKVGVWDADFISFRPFVSISQYVNPNFEIEVDLAVRDYIPDFSIKCTNYFHLP